MLKDWQNAFADLNRAYEMEPTSIYAIQEALECWFAEVRLSGLQAATDRLRTRVAKERKKEVPSRFLAIAALLIGEASEEEVRAKLPHFDTYFFMGVKLRAEGKVEEARRRYREAAAVPEKLTYFEKIALAKAELDELK